jgi:hypothetical protein
VTRNLNNYVSTAAVFLHIEKAFDTIWNTGLLHKLSQLEYSISLIKHVSFFFGKEIQSFGKDEMSTK